MAWRPNHLVESGELDNTVRGRVTGWIRLSGRPEPLRLRLEGDCHSDLAGWRFQIVRSDPVPLWAESVDIDGLATEQVGQVGDITADQLLYHLDCPVEELLARKRLGEPPPMQFRKALYLEWFSEQNGRVVIQDTRLGVRRVGERAFELSREELRRKAEEARRDADEMLRQGLVEEIAPGIIMVGDLDESDRDLRSVLDQQAQDLERAVRESLDATAEDDLDPE